MTAALPRYMLAKPLKAGGVAYYWNPLPRDVKAGLPIGREALGTDLAAAICRADLLNAHLDAWRLGRAGAPPEPRPQRGTLRWIAHVYFEESRAFAAVSPRVQPDYRREIDLLLDIELPNAPGGVRTAGDVPAAAVSARFCDRVYALLLDGPRGHRPRQANLSVSRFAAAWDQARRLYPDCVPAGDNPWRGIKKAATGAEKPAANRALAYALADAIAAHGHPQLALAPLIAFEWLQRPENILAGHIAWTDWRPAHRPGAVQVHHHKTGARVWHDLEDAEGALYPEIEARLAAVERLGVPMVLFRPAKGPKGRDGKRAARPYTLRHARAVVRDAAREAGLPDWLTLDACRHGGLTELGDAGLTETEEMAISAHSTPDAKRRYVKKTAAQRLSGARKRRRWIEAERDRNGNGSQNGAGRASQNER